MKILEAVDCSQHQSGRSFRRQGEEPFCDDLNGKRIAVWGCHFKPRTNDMRDRALNQRSSKCCWRPAFSIAAYDPEAVEEARKIFADRIQYLPTTILLEGADALLVITEWQAFRNPKLRTNEILDAASGHIRRTKYF